MVQGPWCKDKKKKKKGIKPRMNAHYMQKINRPLNRKNG